MEADDRQLMTVFTVQPSLHHRQAPGVIGSALGLVSPLSVYSDWVRWKIGSAASISVWQHIKLSEQIRP